MKFSPHKACIILLLFLSMFTNFSMGADGKAYALKTEYMESPLGIDAVAPRFTWKMQDARPGAHQLAFRISIATDAAQVRNGEQLVWDSGKVTGDKNNMTYQGAQLRGFTTYYWKLELWNERGEALTPVVATFETGMMGMENWKGTWISDGNNIHVLPAAYFRKAFSAAKKVKSARAYIVAAGLYELSLNGKKVGNHRLDPMYTRFDRRNLYVSYDVTASINEGNNAIGVLLGNGWYNHQSLAVWNFDRAPWRARPAFCMDLRITYTDGSTVVIATGGDWKTSLSPVIANSIYTGEQYDARLEQKGWNTIDFDDRSWKEVSLRAAPSGNIVSQVMHPIRNVEEIAVKSLRKFNDSTYLFDLGRNIAGVTSLRVRGKRGTVIRLKHSERLNAEGHADLSNIDVYHRPKDHTDPFQVDVFILSGEGEEVFMPKFNYKGFQYVEVSSSEPIMLDKKSLLGYFMHSDVPAVGQMNSSNPLIDKIWWATNNSYLSNLFGYPTDCPQREKNGWTGDGHFAVETGLYNFDGITIYEKWMADHRDEQQPNGVLPDIIPTGGWGYGTANGTDWTSTIAIIPWQIYLFYGDSRLLEDNYKSIKQYVNYVEGTSKGGLTSFGRGDWVPVKSTSNLEFTSSIYFYVDAEILAKAAKLFNKEEDYQHYTALAKKIKDAINAKYFNAQTGIYASGVQTELSMPLQWGIVPKGMEQLVADHLAKRVVADGMHLDVGVLGAKAVLNALSDHGHGEIAYQLAAQNTYPSWGWWIVNGATTLYENWDINAPRDISQNHMMFGEIGAWFFKGLGGIKADEQQPGFKHILLKPNFPAGLNQFEASFDGPYGKILSSWKRTGKVLRYQVVVPANSTATLQPALAAGIQIYLGGKPMGAKMELEAGQHMFELK